MGCLTWLFQLSCWLVWQHNILILFVLFLALVLVFLTTIQNFGASVASYLHFSFCDIFFHLKLWEMWAGYCWCLFSSSTSWVTYWLTSVSGTLDTMGDCTSFTYTLLLTLELDSIFLFWYLFGWSALLKINLPQSGTLAFNSLCGCINPKSRLVAH